MSRTSAEILAVGNELLIGQTLDTNSHWLAQQLHAEGWTVERITTVQDSLKSIRDGIVESLDRGPKLLFTVGGLGPTYDDMTVKGLSRAIGKPLTLNREALAMVTSKYQNFEKHPILTLHRRKMALLPKGAKPLANPVGTAPGIMTLARRTRVISFPGVPTEMKAIFKSSVIPVLRRAGGVPPTEMYITMVGIIESAVAPLLGKARGRFPNLYWKSHPLGRESGVRSLIKLHVYTVGTGDENALRNAVAFLLKKLSGFAEAAKR